MVRVRGLVVCGVPSFSNGQDRARSKNVSPPPKPCPGDSTNAD